MTSNTSAEIQSLTSDEDSDVNSDVSSSGHHSMHVHPHLWLTLVHILMALWAWLANSTQMINLLLDPQLRRQPRTSLIISISVAELITAGVLCPLYTDSLLRGPWRHGLLTCSVYEAIFYLQVCISSLAVLILNVERLYFLVAPRMLQGTGKRRMLTLLTLLPWAAGVIAVAPLYARGAHAVLEHAPGLHHRTCIIHWDRDLHVIMVFVCFLAPAFLILATATAVFLLYVISAVRTGDFDNGQSVCSSVSSFRRCGVADATPQRRNEETEHNGVSERTSWRISARSSDRISPRMSETISARLSARILGNSRRHARNTPIEPDAKTRRECLLAVLASSGVSVALQFPFFTVLILQLFCQHPAPESSKPSLLPDSPVLTDADYETCQFSDTVWAAVMMTGMAKPGIIPLVWLIYSDVRAGLKLSACACSCVWRRVYNFRRGDDVREENGDPSSAANSLPSLASQLTVV